MVSTISVTHGQDTELHFVSEADTALNVVFDLSEDTTGNDVGMINGIKSIENLKRIG